VNTGVMLFYNTRYRCYRGIVVNYYSKKFNNIGTRPFTIKLFVAVIVDVS